MRKNEQRTRELPRPRELTEESRRAMARDADEWGDAFRSYSDRAERLGPEDLKVQVR